MSQQKFAPVTSNLLARKGGAAPSLMQMPAYIPPEPLRAQEEPVHRAPVSRISEHHAPVHHDPHHDDPAKPKKLFVAMSHNEFERLAIASVKTGLSKHEIVRDALDFYFEQIADDLGHPCACVSGQKSCAGNCVS